MFPTFTVGGSQIRFGQLAERLGEGYRHTVIALDQNYEMADRLARFGNIAYLRSARIEKSFLSSWTSVRHILISTKPDVLVSYNWGSAAWWLGNLFSARLPHVHVEDGFGPDERNAQHLRRMLFRRLFLKNALTHTVLPSRTLYETALRQWGLGDRHISYIPNGVDTDRFQTKRSPAHSGPLTVGTIATLRREKNLTRLIDLFGRLQQTSQGIDLRLVIAGGGPEFQDLKRYASISAAADRITLLGPTNNPEMALKGIDVFAITSDTEQMPLSVLEAMASGLPVIAFSVGDIAAMVGGMNRPFASIPLADDAGFLALLAQLSRDSQMRYDIGQENARRIRDHFTLEKMTDRYSDLFERWASETR